MSQVKVYRTSRWKAAAAVAGCAGFVALGVFMLADRPLVAWVAILFFGGGGLLALFGLLTGGTTLTLGHKGFEMASSFKRNRIRWDEIEAPVIVVFKRNRMIAVNYLRGNGKSGVSRALTGMDLALPNMYGVPLKELCDTMNTYRDRYIGSAAAVTATAAVPAAVTNRAAASADQVPIGVTRPARPVLLAFGAALVVLALNIVLRVVLKLQGMSVTIGIAFGVGALVMLWFLHGLKRPPTPRERSTFLWAYSALIVVPYLGLFLLGAASVGFRATALLVLALHALAYSAAAQMFLADKRFSAMPARA